MKILLPLFILGALGAMPAQAKIYKCTASDGSLSFSDQICPQNESEEELSFANDPERIEGLDQRLLGDCTGTTPVVGLIVEKNVEKLWSKVDIEGSSGEKVGVYMPQRSLLYREQGYIEGGYLIEPMLFGSKVKKVPVLKCLTLFDPNKLEFNRPQEVADVI